jgi:hypothetical protein
MVQRLMRKLLLPAAILMLACGCSGGGVNKVKGQVFYNGEPLSGADLEFRPESDMTLGSFGGQTDKEGRFEIRIGKGTGMNAKPGRFVVLITKGKLIGAPPPEAVATMNEEDRVKALMEAGPGGPGTTGGGSGILPAKYSSPGTSPFKVDISSGENDLNPFRMDGPALKKK